ncbi:alpha/beta fold hydrolase [Trichocoleus sp. FACHB-262]|uniref:alpha/beta fold hydrolase n=1 Tax=Trichocoleus sp. FACHB-262 TaxID=2692869 RepID=UPI001686BE79|nr:alpha/beta hydrolase [Trichocoleus sp. FACHB-262]MBD2122719.1 alpha/beta hydrolase [Trichocoleus sp. FACHB-262]
MFPSFLPRTLRSLKDPTAIALAQQIQQQAIPTPLAVQPIPTAYVHQGNGGSPILLLHGFDSSVLEFRAIAPLLAQQQETWAVDLLGSGFTERVADLPINPSTIRTHLYSFWQTLIQRPVILVGASLGGAAAIDFTLAYPQCVEKLVLIDSVGFSGTFPLGQFLFSPLDLFAVEFWRQRKLLPLTFGTTFGGFSATDLEAIRCAGLHLAMPGWAEAIASFTKSGGYNLSAQQIDQINQPTLILWGDRDDMLGTADAEKFRRAITNSELVWIRDCGHVPHLEKPVITVEEILKFSQ